MNVFTEALAFVVRTTGLSLPVLFFLGYLAALVTLFGALVLTGRALYRSWWTVAALAATMTLRHRVVQTGVNTLENYMHPRMLAFAVGAAGLAAFLRGRSWLAIGLAMLAAIIHPTTGLWFCIWFGVAAAVSDRAARRPLTAAGVAVAGLLGVLLASTGMAAGLRDRMDPAWLSVLNLKDYLFPTRWPFWAWVMSLAYPVLIGLLHRSRLRAGVASPRERGLVAGSFALFLILLASLPLVVLRVPLVVQLQVPRLLWMLELFTSVSVVWWLVERPTKDAVTRPLPRARLWFVAAIVAFAAARGGYVTFVEHAPRPVVRLDLAADDWRDAMDWIRRTPKDAHVLADPGHAWKYGSTVRVAGERDVFQEEVKDAAFALYSRETAIRVLSRINELGDFQQLTVGRARELAAKYELDYLVGERKLDLPVVYENRRFRVYRLRSQ